MALDGNGLGRVLDGDGSTLSTSAEYSTKRPPNQSLFGRLGKNRKEVKRLREIIAVFERETVTAIPAIERIMRERDAALELAAQLKIANESAELVLQAQDRDPLTNLLNRRGFEEAIFEKFGLGTPLLIVYVDVDGLKVTNDTYGHGVGDRLITEVCRRLEEKGEVVARFGGDELAAALRANREPGGDGTPRDPITDPLGYLDAVFRAAAKDMGIERPTVKVTEELVELAIPDFEQSLTDHIKGELTIALEDGSTATIQIYASVGVAFAKDSSLAEVLCALELADARMYSRKTVRKEMIKQAENLEAIQIATGEAEFRDAYNDLGELGERVRDWARQLLVNPDGKFDVDRKFGFQDFAAFSELLAENGKPAASKFIAGLSMGRGIIDPRTAIVPGTHNVTVDQAESVGRGLDRS